MKVVSFFSPEYKLYAHDLAQSCHQFHIDYDIKAVPRFDSWQDGVAAKPQFILKQLQAIPEGSGLLWVDADAKFIREPDFSIFNAVDFAACLFQWSPGHALEMLTGTLFFRNTPRVLDFVKRWTLATPAWRKANLDTPEQMSLKATFEEDKLSKHPLRFLDLPKEWVYITPDFKELYPGKIPVIAHYQASRRIRK